MWKVLVCAVTLLALPQNAVVRQKTIQLAEISVSSKSLTVTPIAMIRSNKLVRPLVYVSPEKDAAVEKFIRQNYQAGINLEVRQSGERRGHILLGDIQPGCYSDFNFSAKSAGDLSFDRSKSALAVTQDIGSAHSDFQRSATQEETAHFAQTSRNALSALFPAINPKTRFKVRHLVATRAKAEANPLLLGSISFYRNEKEYWLFAIVEQVGNDWKPALTEVHRMKDREGRTDAVEESFLDQLDIDGDGVDEIFTRSIYYEGVSYTVYGLSHSVWAKIYDSGYSGC